MQSWVLTQMHFLSSSRAAATVTQDPRMPRCRRPCDGLSHAPAFRLSLCSSHCCYQNAQNLHSQGCTATPASCISPLYGTYWACPRCHHSRTFRSGTDVILVGNQLVGNQKGYDSYYTADTCNAQLEIALRNQGIPNYRIRPRPRPCRQQPQLPQHYMTPNHAKSFEKAIRSQGSDTAHPIQI